MQASALFGLRKYQRAMDLLSETLTLAGPEGYLRTFLDLGEPVQKLVQRMEKTGGAKEYAHRLLKAFGESLNLPEPHGSLSKREYEVLQLVAAGMSNQEIADTLIVAVSTIKVHVRHLSSLNTVCNTSSWF